MAGEPASKEPTMEEILASIRRIISEDDAPATGGEEVLDLSRTEDQADAFDLDEAIEPEPPVQPQVRAPAFTPPPEPGEMDLDDVMLVDPDEEPAPEPVAAFAPAPEPVRPLPREPAFEPPPRRPAPAPDGSLLGDAQAVQAAGALGRLVGTMSVSTGATLNDVVRELLRPMLKAWLDEHLPAIVEAEVQREIQRISRMAN